jgi:hypothetical protein
MKRPHRPITAPICPYCSHAAVLLTDSSEVYHGRDFGPVWICRPCGAWVGTHKNSLAYAPLGRLANTELRAAKAAAHAVFDPLWRIKMNRTPGCTKSAARELAYSWLAGEMGIRRSSCHIGMMDIEQCRRVVDICGAIGKKAKAEEAA